MKKRALLSVFDKTGVIELAKGLAELGYEIISTGGTFKALAGAGVAVTGVSDITGFPECLDGRVKTLHPMIHAGLLAMRGNEAHMDALGSLGVCPIDVVAVNLYPFKETIQKPGVTLEDAIENIDIGGPAMLRSAAKNWQDVIAMTDPADYAAVLDALKSGGVGREQKFALALKVFEHTAAYDAMIAGYLRQRVGGWPDKLTLTFERAQSLRYGENPHQDAIFYAEPVRRGASITDAVQLHGKELSFCNINDTNGAVDLIKEFSEPCVVAVKHANPCGVAVRDNIHAAWLAAHDADPVSIFGGIIAANREIDEATAAGINKLFIDIVIAPSYSDAAFEILAGKKNIRLLRLPDISRPNTPDMLDVKKVGGGLLIQRPDLCVYDPEQLKIATQRAPTAEEMAALKFAMTVCKFTKSNAIVLAKDNATTGIGPGQLNRVTAAEIAIKYAGDKAKGSVMASDAFFPMPDCVEAAAAAGVTAIIQPGGSLKDNESIQSADRLGIAMVLTGVRHFRH